MMKKLLIHVLMIAISAIMYGQTPIDLRESDDPWSLSDAIGSASGPIDAILNSEVIYEIGSRRILQSMKIRTDPDADSPMRVIC